MASKPTYESGWYTPSVILQEIEAGNERAVRKEYTRLRDISQKRLKRLAKAGYADTETYKRNVAHYPKLKDVRSRYDLAQRLSDLARFIESARSTVSGMKSSRRKALETFEEHGYDFVNKSNLDDFGAFMEEYRNQKLDQEYDSGEAADAFRVLEKQKINPETVKEDFEFWLENREEADKVRVKKSEYGDPDALKARVQKYKKRRKK